MFSRLVFGLFEDLAFRIDGICDHDTLAYGRI